MSVSWHEREKQRCNPALDFFEQRCYDMRLESVKDTEKERKKNEQLMNGA